MDKIVGAENAYFEAGGLRKLISRPFHPERSPCGRAVLAPITSIAAHRSCVPKASQARPMATPCPTSLREFWRSDARAISREAISTARRRSDRTDRWAAVIPLWSG